jgi:DNA-binding transcriptional regulator YdaS (Cro superfamily)
MSRPKPHYDRNKNPAHRFSAINRLMGGQIARQEVTEDDVDDMELPVLAAVECIAKGHGTISHWNEIAHVVNQSWILSTERGIGEEAKPYLLVAQDGMKRMAKRFQETGHFAFDALGLEAVRRVVEIWSHQLLLCSIGEVHAAGEVADKHFWKTPEAA